MTQILLIGVNHNDPFGQHKVEQALELAKRKRFVPDCIAVEWKADYAASVIAQREKFAGLLQDCLVGISSADLDMLKHSLAFEADAHVKMYPDLPVFWLDEERVADPSVIDEYAIDRATIICDSSGGDPFNMLRLSHEVIRRGKNTVMPSERDDNFTEIIDAAVKVGYKCIACVVGESHANCLVPGMFGQQLIKRGYMVIRYITTIDHPKWETTRFMIL